MTALLKLPVFDSSYANCEQCELLPQLERGHFCCAYRPEKFNGIMIIGEGPGQQEVSAGRPFVGISGQLLRTLLDDVEINLDECWVTNATLCVEGSTQVRLADGSLDRIDMIVKHRKKVRVQTTNSDGSIGAAAVVDWFRNRRGDRALIRVGFRHGKRAGSKGHVRAIVTEDHPVRTPTGWVAAGQLRNGDLIGTDQHAPIGTSLEIALGTIVGDGCIARSTLIVKHGVKQTQWSDCKKRALSTLGVRQIELSKRDQIGFSTHTSAFWRAMYEKFYVLDEDGKRRIPRDFIDTLTPLSLAVWFLDDGHLAMRGASGRRPCASLSTVSYNRSDVEYLAAKLSTRGLKCSVSAKGVVLFSVVGTVALSAYIRMYVPPAMQYKLLPADRNRFANATYEPMRATTFFDEAVVEVVSWRGENPDQPVYCLEVNGTHNFATPGAVLHNCKPPPKDKALQEAFPRAIPSCLGRLEAEIAAVRPKIIIALGAAAWIAVSGYDVKKTKLVAFDCQDCDPVTRKVGPVLQCAAAIASEDGKTALPCGHLHFFKVPRGGLVTAVDPDELAAVKAASCPKCGASFKRLRPKMAKCPTCGGRKKRHEEYIQFDWDYNITKAAGAIFEPAKVGAERADHELDAWLGEQGVQYIVPTYHPAFVLRGQQFYAKTVQKHFRKVARLLAGAKVQEVDYVGTRDPAVVHDFVWNWDSEGGAEAPLFTVDIETEAIVYNDAGEAQVLDAREIRNVTKIKCFGISTLSETLVVDTRNVDPSDPSDPLLGVLYEFLTDDRIPKAYHHGAGYDIPVIDLIWGVPWHEQVRSAVDDSMCAHQNLYPDEPHRLDHVTFEVADVHAWKPAREVKGVLVHKDYEELERYNARDVWHTAMAIDHFGVRAGKAIPGGRMDRAGLSQVYANDCKLRQISVGMTMTGVPLNYVKFREVGEQSRALIADAELSIRAALKEADHPTPNEVNFNSPPQLVALLFGRDSFFKMAAVDMTSPVMPATTKTHFQKLLSTTDSVLALKVLNGLIELRKQKYVASNFVFAPDMQPWADGRIHAMWQPWGTRTGRFSCSPNLMNIPLWLREAFEAPRGRRIGGADADQLELRMIAWQSGDPELIRRSLTAVESRKLEPDFDPHSFIASIAFSQYTKLSLKDPSHGLGADGKPLDRTKIRKCLCETCKRKALRDIVKRVIYGLNYGAGAYTVLEAIYNGGYEGPPITIAMVEHVKITVFREFSGIPVYRDNLVLNARRDGAVFSPLMKRRRIFPLAGFPGIDIPVTEVYNYPIQSGGADVINEAFILFADELPSIDPTARIIAQIHDAIYYEANEDKAEDCKKLLVQCMTMEKTLNGITMRFSASGKVGKTMVS